MNNFRLGNCKNEYWTNLDAQDLMESYEKGELRGKLSEIASQLQEDSNPVIMLLKDKGNHD